MPPEMDWPYIVFLQQMNKSYLSFFGNPFYIFTKQNKKCFVKRLELFQICILKISNTLLQRRHGRSIFKSMNTILWLKYSMHFLMSAKMNLISNFTIISTRFWIHKLWILFIRSRFWNLQKNDWFSSTQL